MLTQPSKRFGFLGCKELREHAFFAGLDWDAIALKEIKSPLLEYLCENRPENLYQVLKIDEAASLNGLADDRVWNQEYSLRINSKFQPSDSSEMGFVKSRNQDSNYIQVVQQAGSSQAMPSV